MPVLPEAPKPLGLLCPNPPDGVPNPAGAEVPDESTPACGGCPNPLPGPNPPAEGNPPGLPGAICAGPDGEPPNVDLRFPFGALPNGCCCCCCCPNPWVLADNPRGSVASPEELGPSPLPPYVCAIGGGRCIVMLALALSCAGAS